MPIDEPRLWQQVALGEDTALELKEARFRGDRVVGPRRDDLADGLAALANGRGGRLVLGVTDERKAQGLDPAQLDALADLVTEICSDSVKPSLDFSLFRVSAPAPAGGGALVVEVPEGATVHRSPGGHFRRRGNRKRLMDAAEVRRLAHARGQSDVASTDTQVVRNTGVNSLSRGTVAAVRELAGGRARRGRVVEAEVRQGRPARRAPGHRRGRAAGGGRSAGMAAERVDSGRLLPRRPDGRRPAGRRAGHRGTPRPADTRRHALRGPQPARGRVQGPGPRRRAAVQRTRRFRGGGQRGGAPRLRGVGVAHTGCSCSTTAWSCTRPAGCATR